MPDQDSDSELVRVIGGSGDGHFAPAKTVYVDPVGQTPSDVYVLRRLRLDGETVRALVLNTISDPVAVRMYREHVANDAEES